jgi:hypothetical protein
MGGRHRTGKVFFSEEKKQKTFIFPPLPRSRPWPGSSRSAEAKQSFGSFFRKEQSFF